MGRDAYDPAYPGDAVFPNGTWLTDQAYVEKGEIRWNDGMTEEEIAEMSAFAQRFREVNDAILDTDYYARVQKN